MPEIKELAVFAACLHRVVSSWSPTHDKERGKKNEIKRAIVEDLFFFFSRLLSWLLVSVAGVACLVFVWKCAVIGDCLGDNTFTFIQFDVSGVVLPPRKRSSFIPRLISFIMLDYSVIRSFLTNPAAIARHRSKYTFVLRVAPVIEACLCPKLSCREFGDTGQPTSYYSHRRNVPGCRRNNGSLRQQTFPSSR